MPRKKTTPAVAATPVSATEVATPVSATEVDTTEYPTPMTQEELYATGLLPANSLPQDSTLEDATAPVAVLVIATGEVYPAPTPFQKSEFARAIYSNTEAAALRAEFVKKEAERNAARLALYSAPHKDPIVAPEGSLEEAEADDMYGESMSSAVANAFPNAKK